MANLKFPLQKGASTKGLGVERGKCPMCGGAGLGEPGGFAFINGGALLAFDKRTAGPSDQIKAFLTLGYHPPHSSQERGGALDLVKDPVAGQFEFYFCSVVCLRGFLNACVDALEKKIGGAAV